MGRLRVAGVIVLLYVLPFALVALGIIPVDWRRFLYVLAGIVALGVALTLRALPRDFGFRWDNARPAAIAYGVPTLLGIAAIIAVSLAIGRRVRPEWWLVPHFRYALLLPVSAAQEFFYRGTLTILLSRISTAAPFLVLVNAFLFAFLHVIFPDPWFVLPGTFAVGIVFSLLWLTHPNVWIASAAHVALNAPFVLFCFGSFDRTCLA